MSKVEHSVEDHGGDSAFSGPGRVAVETQPVTDDLLSARELALDPGPLIVAAVALPGHPPCPGDRLDVAVALGVVGHVQSRWAACARSDGSVRTRAKIRQNHNS